MMKIYCLVDNYRQRYTDQLLIKGQVRNEKVDGCANRQADQQVTGDISGLTDF